MDLELKGRSVLISGGSKGIGLACAGAFLDQGAKVAVEKVLADGRSRVPLRRYADPENIARVALFLAFDLAAYVTGAIIAMDGGLNPII
ncbi:MAG: SDR family oxidoreductase [Gammaproteobacteria bacterium]